MKLKNLLQTMIICIMVTNIVTSQSNTIQIKNDWHLQSSAVIKENAKTISSVGYDSENWHKIDIPKTVLAAVAEAGVYPDPYFGSNLKSIPGYRDGRWLAMLKDSPFYPNWWYRKSFVVPSELKGKKMVLHLDGINYKANVWLNGQQIADSSKVIGMFRLFFIAL